MKHCCWLVRAGSFSALGLGQRKQGKESEPETQEAKEGRRKGNEAAWGYLHEGERRRTRRKLVTKFIAGGEDVDVSAVDFFRDNGVERRSRPKEGIAGIIGLANPSGRREGQGVSAKRRLFGRIASERCGEDGFDRIGDSNTEVGLEDRKALAGVARGI